MANYFLKDNDRQKTPTGTVAPTVQPNGKTEAPADGKVITTPVGGDAVNPQVGQQTVSPVQNGGVANNASQQAQGVQQPVEGAQQAAAPQQPVQQPVPNMFAQNGGSDEGGQDSAGHGSEGLSDDEKAYMAMNEAIQNNYRKQYKEASDVTQGVFDYLNGGSRKEEEPYRKKNESKKKLLALADAIRQIGNLAHVTRGATSQKFNSPVAEQEARYQQEKALRDKDRAARADAAQKKAKMDADAAYKDALLQLKGNAQSASVYDNAMKRKADAEKFAWNQKKDQANLDLRGRQLDETAKYHEGQLRLGAQRVAAARERNSIARFNAATARMRAVYEVQGVGGLGKGSKTYVTPEGVTYTLSKNFINPANVKTVYNSMVARGLISAADQQAVSKSFDDAKGNVKAGKTGGAKGGTGTNAMLSAILSAATASERGHDTFTYFGKRLGYAYVDGMSDELKKKLIKDKAPAPSSKQPAKQPSQPQQSKPAAKPQSKAPVKPQQSKAATVKKPSASQGGGQNKNKRSQLTI